MPGGESQVATAGCSRQRGVSFGGFMRALVIDHSAPAHLRLADVPEPKPGPAQALSAVKATSLNYGELANAANAPEGTVYGWDSAGIVVQEAADGSGPPKGSRVVGFAGRGGWA